MERDPVCGMTVDPQKTAGRSDHQGRTYYFCSPNCKRQFDQSPERSAGPLAGGVPTQSKRDSTTESRKG